MTVVRISRSFSLCYSCLFILAKRGGEPVGTVTWDNLQDLSYAGDSKPSSDGAVYIAVAIRMSEVEILESNLLCDYS